MPFLQNGANALVSLDYRVGKIYGADPATVAELPLLKTYGLVLAQDCLLR